MSLIAGIDPGSQHLGYAIVDISTQNLNVVESGRFSVPSKLSFAERVYRMSVHLEELFGRHDVKELALEKIFLGKNVDSAFKLGHIRGVCLAQAGKHDMEIAEYAARTVKKAVTGNGGAEKENVQFLVSKLMQVGKTDLSFDESDALALAYCHAQQRSVNAKLNQMKGAQL